MPSPQQQHGKDLQNFQQLPRSPLASYVARAAEDQRRFHYTLSALEPHALWQWITEYLGNRLGPRHKFNTYDDPSHNNGIYKLGDDSLLGGQRDPDGKIRMSIAGDWGTGTDEAAEVGAKMADFSPHYTVHLGDVYYVGEKDEIDENCLGQPDADHTFTPCLWPWGSVGSFALNGNHEMYALGDAYFEAFLPTLGLRPALGGKPGGQKASFFCLENDFWRVIGLDTGYNSIGLPILEYIFSPSCNLRNEELQWIQNKVSPKADRRGLILLTHHQYCSSFDQEYPKTAQQLSALIDRPLVAYDNRQYPSPENITVGYNGFANLTFTANQLSVEYHDLKSNLLLTENWKVENGNLIGTAAVPSQVPGLTLQTDLALATK